MSHVAHTKQFSQAAGVEKRAMRMHEPEMERQQEVRADCRLYTLQRESNNS
jgi:hypothetical protein